MVCTSKNGDEHKQTHRQDKQVNVVKCGCIHCCLCFSGVWWRESPHQPKLILFFDTLHCATSKEEKPYSELDIFYKRWSRGSISQLLKLQRIHTCQQSRQRDPLHIVRSTSLSQDNGQSLRGCNAEKPENISG